MRLEYPWKMTVKKKNCLELPLEYATKRQLIIKTALKLQIDGREKTVGYIIMIQANKIKVQCLRDQ